MTYNFSNMQPVRGYPYAVGDDEGLATIQKVLAAFMPKINEIQAAGDAAAQAQVEKIVLEATGSKPTASAISTATGSTSISGVTGADYDVVGNVCKPRNFPALTAAKNLQMQINRVAKARSFPTISVDGAIGPGTVTAVQKALPSTPVAVCTQVTAQVIALTAAAKAAADGLGAPAPSLNDVAKAAGAGSITVRSSSGSALEFKPPGAQASIFDTVKSLPDTTKLIAVGFLGLGGIFLFKKLRKRGGGGGSTAAIAPVSNPARRRRRRRSRR